MKTYGGVDLYIHVFLESALICEWSATCPGRFTPRERAPGTHWIGVCVGLRAGLDDVEKRKFFILPGLELRSLCRPARSQSLYRLHYPGCVRKYKGHVVTVWSVENRAELFLTILRQMLGFRLSSAGIKAFTAKSKNMNWKIFLSLQTFQCRAGHLSPNMAPTGADEPICWT
jgi:hypothetical protein